MFRSNTRGPSKLSMGRAELCPFAHHHYTGQRSSQSFWLFSHGSPPTATSPMAPIETLVCRRGSTKLAMAAAANTPCAAERITINAAAMAYASTSRIMRYGGKAVLIQRGKARRASSCVSWVQVCLSQRAAFHSMGGWDMMLTAVMDHPDEYNNPMVRNDERLTACEDGTFCCGTGASALTCCARGKGVFITNSTTASRSRPPNTVHQTKGIPVLSSPTLPSLRPSTTMQSTHPHNSANSPPPSSPIFSSSGPTSTTFSSSSSSSASSRPATSVGPYVAAALGGLLAIFLLVSTIVYFSRRRRRRRQLQRRYKHEDSNSMSDSIVVLDVLGPTPPTLQSRTLSSAEAAPPEIIHGRVRPPEPAAAARGGGEVPPGWKHGVVWVDRRRNAVMQMGF